VSLDAETVKRGAILSGGEDVVRGLPATPAFTIPVTATQAGLMPSGTRVEIAGPSSQAWEGFVTEQVASTTDDTVTVSLGGASGAAICGSDCASVPVSGQVLLKSRIVTVESVTGATVPSAALLTTSDGSISVIDDKGLEHRVTVVTSARGMSVVDGVALGTMVRVPAQEG
jgi:hypothetical protein